MDPPVQPKKIVQQSEQVFNPVQIPIILNNQIYLMVQQDIRHIEDTRHISYVKVSQDGQFVPVDFNTHQLDTIPNMITPFPATSTKCGPESFVQNVMNCTRNHLNGTPGFPFHYSEGTSTNDLNIPGCRQPNQFGRSFVETSNKSCLAKEVTCRGINTDKLISWNEDDFEELSALEKMKLRKICDCSSV